MTANKVDMRAAMPELALWIDDQRRDLGVAHVNHCIRQGMAGEAGWFFAMEKGHFLGTPFPATHPISADQELAVKIGAKFAAFIALPPAKQVDAAGGEHGTH